MMLESPIVYHEILSEVREWCTHSFVALGTHCPGGGPSLEWKVGRVQERISDCFLPVESVS